jgi:hypothetical protein
MVSSPRRKVTYPFLVRLVYGVESILDGYTLKVTGGDFQAHGEVQVNLLNGRFRQMKLEDALVIYCCRALVDFPVTQVVSNRIRRLSR